MQNTACQPEAVPSRILRSSSANFSTGDVQFESFQTWDLEQLALDQAALTTFEYVIHKEACGSDQPLLDLKTFYGVSASTIPDVECSNVVYLSVVDMHADSAEAMETVLGKLHKEYGIGITMGQTLIG